MLSGEEWGKRRVRRGWRERERERERERAEDPGLKGTIIIRQSERVKKKRKKKQRSYNKYKKKYTSEIVLLRRPSVSRYF